MNDAQYILATVKHQMDSYIPEIANHVDRMKAIAKKLDAYDSILSVDPSDFPLGPACDLSGEGGCESCS